MDIGIIGLGRMGHGMGARLVKHNHKVFGYDISPEKRGAAEADGVVAVESFQELIKALSTPRLLLISVPAGAPVESIINEVSPVLSRGDVIIDAGNSFYKDSIRRANELKERGLYFIDMGVSGGIWGLEEGFCIMAGGEDTAYKIVEPIFASLAQTGGYARVGESGAGHFAKMVHNGVEYAMMQAYGEGFEILKASPYEYDLAALSGLWNHGSVVRSWLLELANLAFEESPELEDIRGWVEDSGEGRWTVMQSIEESVPAPVIGLSLMMRFRSRQDDSFSAKVIAALREKFGGHTVKKA